MSEVPESLRADFLGLAFKGLRSEYVELVKSLRKEGLGAEAAASMALSLATNLMMYQNNRTFAENNTPVHFIPEDE